MVRFAKRMAAAGRPVRWAVLVALAGALTAALELGGLPAAFLLGPMIAAIVLAVAGGTVAIDRRGFVAAQAVVGLMMAGSIPHDIGTELRKDWLLFVLGVMSTVVAAAALGWSISRARLFPGSTAIWGSAPGAASVMTIMSESFGADMRLVAFMQYTRVVCCAVVAMLLTRFLGAGGEGVAVPTVHAALATGPLIGTLAVAAACGLLAMRVRLPGGALLLSLIVGLILSFTGVLAITLPFWLLAICYVVIGLTVGMRFTPAVVRHAAHALPRVLMSVVALIAVGGLFALALVRFAGVDPLTAYLATTPGGADTVAIIASASDVDVPFVMAMQIARFFFVLLTAPTLARYLSRRMGA
ncbi:AbrB family transcriptional regulator [Falsirhodobacter algicola]|uniref:AbrB family transcriptional regulator n=1 Tax=Falsirhodobacter algicola TaxID=2692330 RepID=A0A8J8SL85_9RHOB|nr:AbrB family transcriptional regulator [Falsirhodobacter algicola]QUS36238.1 AbrB family transcriptional regulator [Falsirhodobacter algicola]